MLNLARLVVTAGSLSNLFGLRDSMVRDGMDASWFRVAVQALCYITTATVLWWPRIGLAASLIALTMTVRGPLAGAEPILVVVGTVSILCQCGGVAIAILLGATVAWIVGLAFSRPTTEPAGIMSLIFTAAVCVGCGVRFLLIGRARTKRRAEELEVENSEIRQVERDRLSRDLHDIVAHRVSQIAMQVRAHRDSNDPGELRDALDEVGWLARSSMTELRGLVEGLRVEGSEAIPIVRVTVHDAMERARDELVRYGYVVTCHEPAEVDKISGAIEETVVRIITEACANVLKYAPGDAPCMISVEAAPELVNVRITSPYPKRPKIETDWQSSGLGLRGLRERVRLIGGSFDAEREDDQWQVKAVLPRIPLNLEGV